MEEHRERGHRILTPNELDLTFRNDCEKVQQNGIKNSGHIYELKAKQIIYFDVRAKT